MHKHCLTLEDKLKHRSHHGSQICYPGKCVSIEKIWVGNCHSFGNSVHKTISIISFKWEFSLDIAFKIANTFPDIWQVFSLKMNITLCKYKGLFFLKAIYCFTFVWSIFRIVRGKYPSVQILYKPKTMYIFTKSMWKYRTCHLDSIWGKIAYLSECIKTDYALN